ADHACHDLSWTREENRCPRDGGCERRPDLSKSAAIRSERVRFQDAARGQGGDRGWQGASAIRWLRAHSGTAGLIGLRRAHSVIPNRADDERPAYWGLDQIGELACTMELVGGPWVAPGMTGRAFGGVRQSS